MERYDSKVEEKMKLFYTNLSEKDKRYYAAVEVAKLGHGGLEYLATLFDCTRQTIAKGLEELENKALVPQGQVRRSGGGRKDYEEKHPHINAVFLKGD
jgi:predicted transcriptional regulator